MATTRGEEFAIESELHRQQNFLVCSSVGCPEWKAALAEINRLLALLDGGNCLHLYCSACEESAPLTDTDFRQMHSQCLGGDACWAVWRQPPFAGFDRDRGASEE